jgi:hypothetical protein
MSSNITPPPVSNAIDFDLFALVTLAEQFGWEGRDAFLVAALLRSNDIDAGAAVLLFRAAGRWIQ